MNYVSYDMFDNKIVFNYEKYSKNNGFEFDEYLNWFDPNNRKQNMVDILELLEGHRVEIPEKDVFYTWQSNCIDAVEFKLVDNFEEDMRIMIERERKHYSYLESFDDDLFGIPGMCIYEDNIVQNGYEINIKHYNLSYDKYCDGSFGYRAITFKRLNKPMKL